MLAQIVTFIVIGENDNKGHNLSLHHLLFIYKENGIVAV